MAVRLDLPRVDLDDFYSDGERRSRFIQTLGDCVKNKGGLAIVTGLGIAEHMAALRHHNIAFFQRPHEWRMQFNDPDSEGERGYVPRGGETARCEDTPDEKAFYQMGPEGITLYRPNLWPSDRDLPGFKQDLVSGFDTLTQRAKVLFGAIGEYCDVDPTDLVAETDNGEHGLRLNHYPAQGDAKSHQDSNYITLLHEPGEGFFVEIKGVRHFIEAQPGDTFINFGEMLQERLGLPAVWHGVESLGNVAEGQYRKTEPFFLHARPDVVLNERGETQAQFMEHLLQHRYTGNRT
jgi:isopenicillin N synthase-like dioxygenase